MHPIFCDESSHLGRVWTWPESNSFQEYRPRTLICVIICVDHIRCFKTAWLTRQPDIPNAFPPLPMLISQLSKRKALPTGLELFGFPCSKTSIPLTLTNLAQKLQKEQFKDMVKYKEGGGAGFCSQFKLLWKYRIFSQFTRFICLRVYVLAHSGCPEAK